MFRTFQEVIENSCDVQKELEKRQQSGEKIPAHDLERTKSACAKGLIALTTTKHKLQGSTFRLFTNPDEYLDNRRQNLNNVEKQVAEIKKQMQSQTQKNEDPKPLSPSRR